MNDADGKSEPNIVSQMVVKNGDESHGRVNNLLKEIHVIWPNGIIFHQPRFP